MEDKEQEYTFVEERVISKQYRVGRFILKLMVNVLLPACVCFVVCYIFLNSSGKLDGDKEITVTTPQHVMSVDDNEDETQPDTTEQIISEEEELMLLEEAINKSVVVVSVARKNTEEESSSETGITSEEESSQKEENTSNEEETSQEENTSQENNESQEEIGSQEENIPQEDMITRKYTGVIVSASDSVYIIMPYKNIEGGEEILTYFPNGSAIEASVYDVDYETGLALLKVESTKITPGIKSSISVVTVEGNQSVDKGTYVVYCGNVVGDEPMFIKGHVSSSGNQVLCTDLNYDVVITDITLEGMQDGFIFSRSGRLVGIVGMNYEELEIPGVIAGAEAVDLEYIINNMLNGKKDIYFGIKGQDVTSKIEELVGRNMPNGIYVNSVIVDSPAYNAGIMPGDIIVYLGAKAEPDMNYFRDYLEKKSKGDEILIKVKRRIGNDYNEYNVRVLLGSRD